MARRVETFLEAAEQYVARPVHGLQNMDVDVASHRQRAASVLVYLTNAYQAADETFVHALVLLDRYISSAILSASDTNSESTLHMAVACFMISMKLREVDHPLIQDLKEITSIDSQSLIHSEEILLQSLSWDIRCYSGNLNQLDFNINGCFSQRSTGLDIVEVILENYDGMPSLKRYSSFLVQISHFDTDMATRFSYAEIAAAAILLASNLLPDRAAAQLLPSSLRTNRTTLATAVLQQVASRHML
jgi:hypothetical protein